MLSSGAIDDLLQLLAATMCRVSSSDDCVWHTQASSHELSPEICHGLTEVSVQLVLSKHMLQFNVLLHYSMGWSTSFDCSAI